MTLFKKNKFNGIQKDPYGTIRHYKDGALHNDDGPAIIYQNGDVCWYVNGREHRIDGPAIDWSGHEEWMINGKHHREDGPAYEEKNRKYFEYWINGNRLDVPTNLRLTKEQIEIYTIFS